MEEKVLRMIDAHTMMTPGDVVIAAVSGGADSMALLHFLYSHRQALGIALEAAHLEHGLRGKESLQDAAYVEEICDEWGVTLHTRRAHMDMEPRPQGLGTEEWGRQLRYAYFEELAKERGAKIATAHTLSDNAETILFRAIRGAGPRGLGGIPPVRGPYIRPLLEVSRAEVLEYCAAHSIAYREDKTNDDMQYSRNKIRMKVLPLLEEAHPGAEQALGRLAADMREVDALLTGQAEELLRRAQDDGDGYAVSTLLAAPQPARLQALAQLVGPQTTRPTLTRLERVLRGELGAEQLPQNRMAYLKDGRLLLKQIWDDIAVEPYEIPLKMGEITLPCGRMLTVEVVSAAGMVAECEKTEKTTRKCFTFTADYDKINRHSVFRTRRSGDRFSPAGRHVTKTLKKWMNEQKIPPNERAAWPLLCDGDRVLWAWDAGFCEGVAPTGETKTLLRIRQK